MQSKEVLCNNFQFGHENNLCNIVLTSTKGQEKHNRYMANTDMIKKKTLMKSLEASSSSVWFTFTFYYTLFLFAWELIFD